MNKYFSKTLLFLEIFLLLIPSTFVASSSNEPTDNTITEDVEKSIYLTFDDGPGGKNNALILDILKSENVCATFFLIGAQIEGQESLILRMKDEGHSLGLHSFSHKRESLYPNHEKFINEMKQVQNSLYNITGETYNILRFPFGCNNNSYSLTTEMVDAIHYNNMKIYDWNVDSTDGENPYGNPDLILKNSLSNKDNIILLMHCSYINKNSAIALKGIIHYYKDKGYTFKKITDETPELYKLKRR